MVGGSNKQWCRGVVLVLERETTFGGAVCCVCFESVRLLCWGAVGERVPRASFLTSLWKSLVATL